MYVFSSYYFFIIYVSFWGNFPLCMSLVFFVCLFGFVCLFVSPQVVFKPTILQTVTVAQDLLNSKCLGMHSRGRSKHTWPKRVKEQGFHLRAHTLSLLPISPILTAGLLGSTAQVGSFLKSGKRGEKESLNRVLGHLEFISYAIFSMETSSTTVGEGSPI